MTRKKRISEEQLPKYVTIGGIHFSVELDSRLPEYGECDAAERIIKINPKYPETLKETLFHEMIHGAFGIAGLSEVLEEKQEEAICRCLENMLKDCIDIKGLK